MNKPFTLDKLFTKKTIIGVPKKYENLSANPNGFHIFGQNIKYQYPQRVLMDEKYLQKVDSNHPILAYTSSVGEIGLISESFYRTGDNGAFQGLFPIVKIGRRELLYILTVIKKHFVNFGYNTSMSNIMSLVIELPVVKSLVPNHEYTIEDVDWKSMRDYITKMEYNHITKLNAYLTIKGLYKYEMTEEDKSILKVKPFFSKYVMHDIFELLPVKKARKSRVRNTPSDEFHIPVVYAKFGDNGIMYWGKKNEFTTYSNVISIVYNGAISAGKCYAQEDETGILAESYLIRYKYGNVPFLANLYMSRVIEHTIYPLYSRENLAIWNNRVENDIIELPTTSTGEIDFDYMERYIRALEKTVITDVIKYKDQVIQAAKEVVAE